MVYFMENPIKMDDLGVPLFLEAPFWRNNNHLSGAKRGGDFLAWLIEMDFF